MAGDTLSGHFNETLIKLEKMFMDFELVKGDVTAGVRRTEVTPKVKI